MKQSSVRRTLLVALPMGVLLGIAGSVLAADPKLDEASTHVERAIAALEAAENADGRKKAPFRGHRRAALEHLKNAKREIGRAKMVDGRDDPRPTTDGGKTDPGEPKTPTTDGGKTNPGEPKTPTTDGGKTNPGEPKTPTKPGGGKKPGWGGREKERR